MRSLKEKRAEALFVYLAQGAADPLAFFSGGGICDPPDSGFQPLTSFDSAHCSVAA